MNYLPTNMRFPILFLLIVLLIQGCGQDSSQNQSTHLQKDTAKSERFDIPITSSDNQALTTPNVPKIINPKFNDFARLVAGLPLESGSELAIYTQTDNYKTFMGNMEKSWAKVDSDRFAKMRAWANQELAVANQDHTPLFYPFSGPDFVNAYNLFPQADSYTLIGLETVMPFPDLSTFNAKMIDNYFISVLESIDDLLDKSYFLTRKMSKDFQRGRTEGILPVLCLFIVRTGHTITNIEQVNLAENGKIISTVIDTVDVKLKGVKVSFFAPKDNRTKTVYYFRQDLSNSGLKQNPNFAKFLANLPISNSYFKSASYLLHFPYFTDLRPIILDKSRFILQDDTGMPFRFFNRSQWDLTVYGIYDKPIRDFKNMGQKDLKGFYDSLHALGKVTSLPFDLGYHWGTKENNLIRAIKK
jgi:hypothetical protein